MPAKKLPPLESDAGKDAIIMAMLPLVAKSGWSLANLKEGVIAAGYGEGDEFRAFNGSLDKVLEQYFAMVDRDMEARLADVDLESMRVKDRVAAAVMIRLRMLETQKEVVQKTLRYLAHPVQSTLAMRTLYKTLNSIWYACGDTATDFNFYTKRALLGAVYSATLLHWLKDTSEDSISTRAFLSRRLDQVMMIPKVKSQVKEGLKLFLKPFTSRQ